MCAYVAHKTLFEERRSSVLWTVNDFASHNTIHKFIRVGIPRKKGQPSLYKGFLGTSNIARDARPIISDSVCSSTRTFAFKGIRNFRQVANGTINRDFSPRISRDFRNSTRRSTPLNRRPTHSY